MKFWLVVNVRICERLHCNHWKYILKDTREYFSVAPRWLHFRESKRGCIRVSRWSKARCNHGGQYRGHCHPGVRSVNIVGIGWYSPFSIERCILAVKKDQSVGSYTTCASLCTSSFKRGLQVYFRCPLCQSLLSIMWNSTLMKMWKLEGHLGEQKHLISIMSQYLKKVGLPDISILTGPHLPSQIPTVCLVSQSIMMTQSSRALSRRWP